MADLQKHTHRRFNPLTGEWVLVSPHRNKRPWQGQTDDPAPSERPGYDANCYLCPGNTRASGQQNPDYQDVFVFTNDFSALLPETPQDATGDELFQAQTEQGICRVVCFSPDHSLTLAQLPQEQVEKVIRLWQHEFIDLGSREWIRHVQIFENKGAIMGCSNPHPHGQIWAQSSVPPVVQEMTRRQQEYFQKTGRSMLSDVLEREMREQVRVVATNASFAAWVPFWAVWPFEVMIAPRRHLTDIAHLQDAEIKDFASILSRVATAYDRLFATSFPYSAGIRQRPTDGDAHPGWHWHMSFFPPLLRSASVKKFMVGYEMFAMPQRDITAEQAAERIREQIN
jgi:UDPglucose--hexose-1-phosphate uridylyltransferase